ncbi:MAG: serine/threonine protein kinase, partial [Coleofasciculus sp.]
MLQLPDVVHQRYQLQQKLGQNASRQTWLAMDLLAQPSQPVILKLLAFNPQMQWEDLKLFEREAQVLQQL